MITIGKLLTGACLLTFMSCQKQQNDGYGNILITLKHDGNIVYPAVIYIKSDGTTGNQLEYDDMQVGDPYGQTYFSGLKPGTYFLRASGYDGKTHSFVSGQDTVNIGLQVRTNEKAITVALN